MIKRIFLVFVFCLVACGAVWAVIHFSAAKRMRPVESAYELPLVTKTEDPDAWSKAVEKVQEVRLTGGGGIEVPAELRHYTDRHWFLAAQVAEVAKYNLSTCQDFVDLAAMIEKGDMVPVPAVTDTYVLFGVGAKADESVFTKYQDDHSIALYDEAELNEIYKNFDEKRSKLQSEIAALQTQSATPKKGERANQNQLQRQITTRQQELAAGEQNRLTLDEFYGQPDSKQKLLHDYQSLQTLAKDYRGRSYDLNNLADRQVLRINMLSSLRPAALKILEDVASAYHRQFDRPLPVSSLVRPEQYQHALRRVNRYAVMIDTPPHSTGLAFDIDYRYMSAAEQNFLMSELARLKKDGRIEVIRERGANYHVFAFIDGTRPSDDLIAACLEKAGAPPEEIDKVKELGPNSNEQKEQSEKSKGPSGKSKGESAKGKGHRAKGKSVRRKPANHRRD